MENDDSTLLPCDGKLAFNTKRQAQAEATSTNWRYGSRLKVYVCKYCELWHLATDYSGINDT